MIGSLLYVLVAILILSFLIFIHELGHYYVARRVGMRVDAFSIGFGKPVYSWTWDGVDWRIGWLPFGGYVKIAGGEEQEGVDPYQVPNSFFGRPPLDRIKVLLAGPIANLLVAFLVFFVLWASGGREKTFGEFTPTIGWVDPQSALYKAGIRPGDEITFYGDRPFHSRDDHTTAPMISPTALTVKGNHVNLQTGERAPFEVTVDSYPNPSIPDKEVLTAGIIAPAQYLIYDPRGQNIGPNSLASGSPLLNSGLEPGDRIVWANGEPIFSQYQLRQLMNGGRALITVERGKKVFLRRVPRVLIQELKLDSDFREELVDWQYEAQLHRQKTLKLYVLPYNLTSEGVVENPLRFVEREQEKKVFPDQLESSIDEPLQAGDRVIAVNGVPIHHAYEVLAQLQEPKVILIASREPSLEKVTTVQEANSQLVQGVDWGALQTIVSKIGLGDGVRSEGNLYLIDPIVPKIHAEFANTPELRALYAAELTRKKAEIDSIDNPERRARNLHELEETSKLLYLGPPAFLDRKVIYNPSPFTLFSDVFRDIQRTLGALLSGRLSPKWLVGPVGIVAVVQHNWETSIKEGLYWIGAISLNLGILNLLPIPVLDGGSICFSLFELITGRKIKPKTMERLIIPFALLLMTLLLFLTYQDVLRLFTHFLR